MIVKNIKHVLHKEILAEDIYVGNILFVKKGTQLTKKLLTILKRKGIEEITVETGDIQTEPLLTPQQEKAIKIHQPTNNPTTIINDKNMMIDTFYETLFIVGYENRLGRILNKDEDVQFLLNLLVDMSKKYRFFDVLYALKTWDYYSFIHSFDVFILGTLLARKQGIPNIESVALGYLFHDIGKLKIPQEILQKRFKLTWTEYEIVKKHTTEGESLLCSFGQKHIAHYARSHHERMDGSGYPDQLLGKEFSKDLKILQIVDVYSALTLKRPYKNAIPAPEAIQILLRNENIYDKDLLHQLIESLTIYPSASTVLLSDNTTAKIKQVNQSTPTLPSVTRFNEEDEFSLPLDLSVTVSKLIKHQSKDFQTIFEEFFQSVINGSEEEAADPFTDLIDGLKLEDIYTKILLPVYWKVVDYYKNNKITSVQFHFSSAVLDTLLKEFELEMIKPNQYSRMILFIIDDKIRTNFLVKVLRSLLHLENIFPLILYTPVHSSNIRKFAYDYDIKEGCFINLNNDKTFTGSLHIPNCRLTKKTMDDLLQIFKDIMNVKEGSLNMYERIFALSTTRSFLSHK